MIAPQKLSPSRPSPNTFRYKKPFPGKTATVDVEFLLFSPSTYLKFAGMTMRGVFAYGGHESLFKSLERCVKHKTPPTPALLRKLRGLVEDMPKPYPPAIQTLMDGLADLEAIPPDEVSKVGAWAAFLAGFCTQEELNRPDFQFILDIERRTQPILQLLVRKQLNEARQMMLNDPLLTQFVWPAAIERFNGFSLNDDLNPLFVAIVLEIQLSILACRDISHCEHPSNSWFASLLPSAKERYLPPTSQFFDWLKKEIGASSIGAMLDDDRLAPLLGAETERGQLDESTLKRWSCGQHHPSTKLIEGLAKALYPEDTRSKAAPLGARHFACRLLNTLGYLAQTLSERASKATTEELRQKWQPWPALPFGHTNFEEWCQARYPIWLEFHHQRQRVDT